MIERNLNRKIMVGKKLADYADIYSIDKANHTVICDLFDEEGIIIDENRLFVYEGDEKDIPFTMLSEAEIELLNKKR